MFTETTDFKILILINIYVDDAFTKRNSVIELVAYYCLSLSISQRNTGNKKHPHTHIYATAHWVLMKSNAVPPQVKIKYQTNIAAFMIFIISNADL